MYRYRSNSVGYLPCGRCPIIFTDLSTSGAGPVTGWEWAFEADTISRVQNPVFEYKTPGIKPVALTAFDGNGCKDTKIIDLPYLPVPALVVVEPTKFTACIPADIYFSNLSYPIDEYYTLKKDKVTKVTFGTLVTDNFPSKSAQAIGMRRPEFLMFL